MGKLLERHRPEIFVILCLLAAICGIERAEATKGKFWAAVAERQLAHDQ